MRRTLCVSYLLALVFFSAACAEPPLKEMNQAQGAIDAARAAGAERYATSELASAADALKRSEQAVTQNDYRLALSLAIESRERAQNAAKQAVDNLAKARGDAERVLAEANSQLTQLRARLNDQTLAKLPRRTATDLEASLAALDAQMQEARTALAQTDYERTIAGAKSVSVRMQEITAALDKPSAPPPARKRR